MEMRCQCLVIGAIAMAVHNCVGLTANNWIDRRISAPLKRIVKVSHTRSALIPLTAARNNEDQDSKDSDDPSNDEHSDRQSLDDFLDTPFYDPQQVLEDENSSDLSKKFANFVTGDYETAEAVLVGAYFVVLVIVTQELLRMQLYGDQYVPFSRGGNGLF